MLVENVLVTGASQGLGEELAVAFAGRHANIILTARNKALLEQVRERCEIAGATAVHVIPADMASEYDVVALSERATTIFNGQLQHLLLNHKFKTPPKFMSTDLDAEELLRQTMEVNFFASTKLTHLCLQMLAEGCGHVTVCSSYAVSARQSYPRQLPYCASKRALDGYFHGLRAEFQMQHLPITITVCTLGAIDTAGLRTFLKDQPNLSRILQMAASSESVARAIISAADWKKKEMFYPWFSMRFLNLVGAFPYGLSLLDWVMSFYY